MSETREAAYRPNRHRVVSQLRQFISELNANGETMVPSEAQLTLELGVSRATVRDALTRLEAEGLILRRKGADTIINSAALDLAARIDLQVDFLEILNEAGFKGSVRLLEAGQAILGSRETALLKAEAGTSALRTVKLWMADGRPVMIAVDWIPTSGDVRDIDCTRPVFELAATLTGEDIGWEVVSPGATAVRGEVARRLGLQAGEPVWTLERVGLSRTGRRCFLAIESHVPSIVRYGFVRTMLLP
jgi:GntR family transcriptional regulator